MSMSVDFHLNFPGNCLEAFTCYEKIFDTTIEFSLRYGDSPLASTVDSDLLDKIVHASLPIGKFILSGTDLLADDYQKPCGFSLTLQAETLAEAERLFNQLSEKGEVSIPLQKTFWATAYGLIRDRFGVSWEINFNE